VDQPASAGLGTEPGRERPGKRGEGRSADLRCVSGETCRPRCITAPCGAAGEAAPRPYKVGRPIPGQAYGCDGGALAPPCRGQAVPDPSGPRGPAHHRGCPSAVGRDHRRVLVCAAGWPRPWRGRTRQRLAPTTWDNPSPVGHMGATVGRWPRPGRGQAVPDPPARRAGMSTRMPVGGRLRSSPRAGVCRGLAAPMARAGEAAPRPDKVGRPIAGRTCGCDGGTLTPALSGSGGA